MLLKILRASNVVGQPEIINAGCQSRFPQSAWFYSPCEWQWSLQTACYSPQVQTATRNTYVPIACCENKTQDKPVQGCGQSAFMVSRPWHEMSVCPPHIPAFNPQYRCDARGPAVQDALPRPLPEVHSTILTESKSQGC